MQQSYMAVQQQGQRSKDNARVKAAMLPARLGWLLHGLLWSLPGLGAGVSNDVLIAQPKDAFSHHLIQNLSYWRKWLFFK
jgi:hypothetical protein